jgi:hypothetical protein
MIKKRICCYEAVRTATDSDRDVEVVGDEELLYMEEIRVCRSVVELHRVILVPVIDGMVLPARLKLRDFEFQELGN